jgi:hypothetical protein
MGEFDKSQPIYFARAHFCSQHPPDIESSVRLKSVYGQIAQSLAQVNNSRSGKDYLLFSSAST